MLFFAIACTLNKLKVKDIDGEAIYDFSTTVTNEFKKPIRLYFA